MALCLGQALDLQRSDDCLEGTNQASLKSPKALGMVIAGPDALYILVELKYEMKSAPPPFVAYLLNWTL